MKSLVLDRRATNDLAFQRDALYAVISGDVCDEEETIVGYTGRVARWAKASDGSESLTETVLVEGDDEGFTAVAVLSDGRVAVAERTGALVLLAPDGSRLRSIQTSFGASTDWLAVGGTPERLYAATTSSSSQKKCVTVAEIDVGANKVRHLGFRSSRIPSMGPFGIARIESNKTIAEYAWKGPVKKVTGPVFQYGHWSVIRHSAGWFVFQAGGGHLLDFSEQTLWTTEDKLPGYRGFRKDDVLHTACAVGGDRLLLATTSCFCLIDGATGEFLASCERQLAPTEEQSGEGRFAWDGGSCAALPSERGIELVFDLPALSAEAGAAEAQLVTKARPTPVKGKSRVASQTPDPMDGAIFELERLAAIICGSEDAAEVRRAHRAIEKLDILEASDEPTREKRVQKVVKTLRSRRKVLGESPVAREIDSVLDTVTDS